MSESETPIFENERDHVPGDAQDDAHPDRPASAVGALLQASRRRAGEDLDDVANLLRISRRYLQAIEAGDMKTLPGAAYALGFVRAYADHLGLDSAEVVRRFKLEVSATQSPSELVFPSPIPESGIPGGAILFFGALIAALAYGGWYYTTNKQKNVNAMVEPVPSRLANDAGVTLNTSPRPAPTGVAAVPDQGISKPSPAPLATTDTSPTTSIQTQSAPSEPKSLHTGTSAPDTLTLQTQTTQTQAALSETGNGAPAGVASKPQARPVPPVSVSSTPAPTSSVTRDAASPPPLAKTAKVPALAPPADAPTPAPTPTPPPVPAPAPASATPTSTPDAAQGVSGASVSSAKPATMAEASRITVHAKANSWIQIRDEKANQTLFTRLLRAGAEFRVPDRAGLRLVTGNAGALEITVDGKPVPPIGGEGAVRQDVVLDPARLKAGTAVIN